MTAAMLGGLIALLYSPLSLAQLPFETTSVAPERFVSVHGRKATVMGYAATGLELWTYPLQLVSGYEPGFRSPAETSEIKAATLLRRVTYEPEAIIRTYIGPDFIVRERLFVPLNEQAVLVTYTVEGPHSVDIVIHFTPVLDLMWPASLGGQNTHWDAAASAYILAEGTQRYHAFIGAPGVVSHDPTLNSAQPGTLGKNLAFAVRVGGSANASATVVVAAIQEGSSPAARMAELLKGETKFETEARAHYAELLRSTLRIETPDDAVNQQLAWAQIALDQAWVCNEVLGCGLVAGYGPSRDARRPQYDWFFAGDALVAINALVDSEDYDRAREALAFIAKYQDPRTGMIWHELSQSADPADWATKYPYMFVHVDITFHYLVTLGRYVSVSGDTKFLEQNWRGIEAAYRYCESLLNAADGLPRIPSSKEGGNEQDKMNEDLGLSASWVAASAAFSQMATLSGHTRLAEEAMHWNQRARNAAARRYWDDGRNAWIDGYDVSGHAMFRLGDSGVVLVTDHILDQQRCQSILDRLASSDFETDWGTRSVAASSSRFDPASYGSGSVWGLGTATVASAFWSGHRPYSAFPIWSSLLPWGTLDSLGHMHEVLAGDFYHQQEESVPEQTWSSAGFLSSAVQGLLGLTKEAQPDRLQFSPHLPPGWDFVSIENIKTGGGHVRLSLRRVPGGLQLQAENSGLPVELTFSPQIPFGAHIIGAQLNGKPVDARSDQHAQDTHATLMFTLGKGSSDLLIRYEGGVSLSVSGSAPLVGEPSELLKIVSVAYRAEDRLLLDVDVSPLAPISTIWLWTDRKPLQAHGAKLETLSAGKYELAVKPLSRPGARHGDTANYQRVEIMVDFAAGSRK